MRVELLYPPVTDPTAGYHSLSYLAGYARAHGFVDTNIRDVNIEAFHYSLTSFDRVSRELRARRDALLTATPEPGSQAEAELTALLAVDLVRLPDLRDAVHILQSATDFYDYRRYRWAVERITAWMALLTASGLPGSVNAGFLLAPLGRWACRTQDLCDHQLLARMNQPFARYYQDQLLPSLAEVRPQVIGINITYTQQLPFALWMGRLIKRARIADWLVCGGTEVSDIWKYLAAEERFFAVFDDFDAVVVGEGESLFVELLSRIEKDVAPGDGTGALVHPRRRPQPASTHSRPLFRIEPLKGIPAPDYRDLPWHLYLSPHRFVYYSPTRGCYWNKCTFCDYGLNEDAPTSPWRQDSLPKILDELEAIADHAEFVYFSVDVLAPAMQLRLAEALIERKIDICWGAEIRLEKYWSAERCRVLRQSGCVAVSVGFESACQRVLDLIDKGTRTPSVLRTVTNLNEAGIAVQMMGFTGFPTETLAEALESVDFLREHRDLWTFGGLGEFDLTPGAIVARDPGRFGVTNVRPRQGDDILRVLSFDTDNPLTADEHELLRAAKRPLRRAHLNRPWLGGTDTPHSYFYHARYGTRVLDVIGGADMEAARRHRGRWVTNGRVLTASDGYGFVDTESGGRLRSGEGGFRTAFLRADGRTMVIGEDRAHFLAGIAATGDPTAAAQRAGMDAVAARRMWVAAVRNRIVLPDATPTTGPEAFPHCAREVEAGDAALAGVSP